MRERERTAAGTSRQWTSPRRSDAEAFSPARGCIGVPIRLKQTHGRARVRLRIASGLTSERVAACFARCTVLGLSRHYLALVSAYQRMRRRHRRVSSHRARPAQRPHRAHFTSAKADDATVRDALLRCVRRRRCDVSCPSITGTVGRALSVASQRNGRFKAAASHRIPLARCSAARDWDRSARRRMQSRCRCGRGEPSPSADVAANLNLG